MTEFSERLKTARKRLNWTQEKLAAMTALPASSIAQYETDARKPSFDVLCRIIDALEVSADYLLGRRDESLPIVTGELVTNYGRMSGDDRVLFNSLSELLAERNKEEEKNDLSSF
jgi:transcriptional regulator with XRE-family HTH domain